MKSRGPGRGARRSPASSPGRLGGAGGARARGTRGNKTFADPPSRAGARAVASGSGTVRPPHPPSGYAGWDSAAPTYLHEEKPLELTQGSEPGRRRRNGSNVSNWSNASVAASVTAAGRAVRRAGAAGFELQVSGASALECRGETAVQDRHRGTACPLQRRASPSPGSGAPGS